MNWTVVFTRAAERDFDRLGAQDRKRVGTFLAERLATHPDPRALGRRPAGVDEEIWRFRSGDIRILTRLRERELEVLVIEIGHRREIYR